MTRPFNFSAGPAVLPESVLKQVQAEMLDWHQGMSVMEMSHRSKAFVAMTEQCEALLRELLNIPDDYAVLFMQGGATAQFSMVPMNLLRGNTKADYINTGIWSKKAIQEAERYCDVKVVTDASKNQYNHIPERDSWTLRDDAAYLHYTPNETVNGIEFSDVPKVNVPLVADMSSNILSRPINVSDYALIYAGAQKNMGPSGITLVIVRKDLVDAPLDSTPSTMAYKNFSDCGSLYNTPPTFAWYVCKLVFEWVKAQGGVAAMEQMAEKRSRLLYDTIDNSDFYSSPVHPNSRSRINVPFSLKDSALDKTFLAEAEKQGLHQLEGHRSVGGMRASLYNAMPLEGVQALCDFMRDFERRNG